MIWSEERTTELAELWSRGWSVSKIAQHYDIGRGSVSGKLNRMGLLGKKPDRVRDVVARRKPNPSALRGTWDDKVFEPYAHRKIRKAHERAIQERTKIAYSQDAST